MNLFATYESRTKGFIFINDLIHAYYEDQLNFTGTATGTELGNLSIYEALFNYLNLVIFMLKNLAKVCKKGVKNTGFYT